MSTTVKQRANVYTVMLIVSLLCLILACLFLYFEIQAYLPTGADSPWKVPPELRAN
jgi:hypothetical protein